MRVSFNDYMWLQTPDRLFNKAYMSKWGFPLGEVSIMFENSLELSKQGFFPGNRPVSDHLPA